MTRNGMAAVSVVTMAVIVAVAALVASNLPGNVPLPTHWNIAGEPDSFSDKWTALLMPLIVAGPVSLLFYFLPKLEPRSEGLSRSGGLVFSAWAGTLLLSLLVQLAVVSVALHWSIHGTSFVLLGIGAVFVLIGNQLGKSRSMYLVGIRTPWTLSSEEVWIKTHRLAGKLMLVGGVLLALAGFMRLPSAIMAVLLVLVIALTAIVPAGYSYVLWRRERPGGETHQKGR